MRRLRALVAAGTSLVAVALASGPVLAESATSGFSAQETLTRTHLVKGVDQVVDSRSFSVSVDSTQSLRDRQEITVSWSGAHPTGGLVADRNSGAAAEEEYPVVLMECRGTPDTVTPQTCWTQTPAERFASDYTFFWPSYRMDRYAAREERHKAVGQPTPLPDACSGTSVGVQHWVPFDAADGKVYPGGSYGCAGMAPEANNFGVSLQPGNTTYAATDADGNGTSSFVLQTAQSNASLGCSREVACSLVVVPVMGISCDAQGALADPVDRPSPLLLPKVSSLCTATGHYGPGELSSGLPDQEDLAVSGRLWWAASNWRGRIAVPLGFAQDSDVCALSGQGAPSYLYGSQLLAQATAQWGPRFCLDRSLFTFKHVVTSEVQAKNLLATGSVEAAVQAVPPTDGFGRPVVQAPVALTGFSVSYVVDDAKGHEYVDLKLTPRLLAKLLTESYPSNPTVLDEYPALAHNPQTVVHDPELRALNPGLRVSGFETEPASTLFVMSSDSDVMTALTSYIDADPDARAFLDGHPDPWGMVVNPSYKGIALPTASWPLLDTFEPPGIYRPESNPCLASDPVPWLPQVAAPVNSLATITLNLQFGIANSQIVCTNGGQQNQKLTAVGREVPGYRFLLGVTSLADAKRYQLRSAALLTQTDPAAAVKFDSPAGRTFIPPTVASLTDAAAFLKGDDTLGSWTFPYGDARTDPAAAYAYPGTLLMSLDVPTSGLSQRDAARYAALLRFAAGPGQTPGLDNGQLPPGYLPLTAADHLGAQVAYTKAAAAAVAAQSGDVPLVSDPSPPTPAPTPKPSAATPSTSPLPVVAPVLPQPPVTPSVVPRVTLPQVRPTPVSTVVPAPLLAAARGVTPGAPAVPGGQAIPLLVLVGLVAAAGGVVVNAVSARSRR